MRAPVVVIGGGPAGLAAAGALRRRGLDPLVLERGSAVGTSWRGHYDRLRLNTPRALSHLPGARIARRHGPWVARDDLVGYLEGYARGLHIELDTEARRIERADDGWSIETSAGRVGAAAVVVATGPCRVPRLPDWAGPEVVHSSAYRNALPYRGRTVAVVGTGNSGAEIATDLAEGGARRVLLAARTPPQLVPRTVLGIPTTLLAVATRHLPPAVGDALMRALRRAVVGDLAAYGLPLPAEPISRAFRRSDVVPIVEPGSFVAALRAGRIEVVPAVAALEPGAVVLADGTKVAADAVIAATGYACALEPLVGHLGVLDDGGRPRAHGARPAAPGLHFIGFTNPLSGNLRELRLDARRIARTLATTFPRRSAWDISKRPRPSGGPGGEAPSRAAAAP
jgi:putative flavoprotein involved in K+ transport